LSRSPSSKKGKWVFNPTSGSLETGRGCRTCPTILHRHTDHIFFLKTFQKTARLLFFIEMYALQQSSSLSV
jgi:hypothetical protein